MASLAEKLRERRLNIWEQMKAITDLAVDENRNFTGEEQGKYEGLNEELDNLDDRIKGVLEQEKRSKDADAAFEQIARGGGGVTRPGGGLTTPSEMDLAEKFRALARGEIRSVDVNLPSYAEQKRAVEMRGIPRAMVEMRTLLDTTTPLPTSFIGQLYQYLVDTSSMRATNPQVYTTSSGEPLTIPRSTAEGNATWTGENVALTPSDPTLSSVTLNAYKAGKVIFVSNELLADTGFDLLGFLAQHAGRNIGILVDTAYVVGVGTTQPTGFLGAATSISMGTGTAGADPFATVKAGPLFDAFHGVLPQYRPRASWLMQDNTIKAVRKITDSTGQYIWQPGLQLGQPDAILGRPVYPDPNMDATGATARKIIAFGDFGGYWIRDVTPLRFERSDEFKFDSDVVSFRALYRTDGKLGDTQAIRVLATLT